MVSLAIVTDRSYSSDLRGCRVANLELIGGLGLVEDAHTTGAFFRAALRDVVGGPSVMGLVPARLRGSDDDLWRAEEAAQLVDHGCLDFGCRQAPDLVWVGDMAQPVGPKISPFSSGLARLFLAGW